MMMKKKERMILISKAWEMQVIITNRIFALTYFVFFWKIEDDEEEEGGEVTANAKEAH